MLIIMEQPTDSIVAILIDTINTLFHLFLCPHVLAIYN